MIYEPPCPPNTPLTAQTYSFLEPVRMRVRRADGTEVLTGYGVGEQIEVMEPVVQYLVTSHVLRKEIPLADGSAIIEFPTDLRVKRVI